MSFVVAIVGRPNVGKSTLFNRLVGARRALVDDVPGVTRDRREGAARLGPLRFTAVDTAGLADAPPESLQRRMLEQTRRAAESADVALLMVDGRAEITPEDQHFARELRALGGAVVVVVNKCEGRAGDAGLLDAFALGLGEPVAISAEHGEGLGVLYDALAPFAPADTASEDAPEAADAAPLRLAIVGRPNVGKSTLLNRLVGDERAITGPEPGITRDAVAVSWSHRGRAVTLVDTAGLRRRARVVDKLEKLSTGDAARAVRQAEVVVLVIDAEAPLERQDLTIARLAADEGRALVVALNKWDLIARRKPLLAAVRERLAETLPQLKGTPVVALSALTGAGVGKLMPAVFGVYDEWNRRVATGRLNRWLEETVAAHPPPVVDGRRPKLRYVTQVKARPPTFVLFTGRPEALSEGYRRYLVNRLREAFGFAGVPLRLALRAGENPYAKRRRRR